MSRLTFADLFSGAGLFSEGFASAGFRPAFAIDLDPAAISTYNQNVGNVGVVGSVRGALSTGKTDVLIAGPPCQGFSTLGRRDAADERNLLCLEIPRWAADTGASVVVTENVPPFVNSEHWQQMTRQLRRGGYEITVWVLDAADFGAPQRRKRAFTIASKIGVPEPPIPIKHHISAKVAFRRTARSDPLHTWPEPTALALKRMSLVPPKGDKRDILLSFPELCPASWHRLGTQEATDAWGRIDLDKPANTIRCRFQNPSVGRYTHPTENRVLSLREGARLQGIPDSWVFFGGREAIARQIGNGVPIPLAAAVAQSVRQLFISATRRHQVAA